jgi:hypothetical protein
MGAPAVECQAVDDPRRFPPLQFLLGVSLIVFGLTSLTISCGGGSDTTTTTPPTVLVALAGNGAVQPGGTAQVTATVANDPGKRRHLDRYVPDRAVRNRLSDDNRKWVPTTDTAWNIPEMTDLSVTVTASDVVNSAVSNGVAVTSHAPNQPMLGERRAKVTSGGGATTLTVSGAVELVMLPE